VELPLKNNEKTPSPLSKETGAPTLTEKSIATTETLSL